MEVQWSDVHNTVIYVVGVIAGIAYRYINSKVADLARRLKECEDRHAKKDAEDAK